MLRSSLLRSPHAFTGTADGDLRPGAPGVAESSSRLVQALGGVGPLRGVHQVHGARVVHAAALDGPGEPADAIVSASPAVAISVRVADCVPILVEGDGVVAAVHAGWRGTAADITRHAVAALRALAPTGTRIRAAVGPAICGACYEVGEDVLAAVGAVTPGQDWRHGRHVDLALANTRILESLGVEVDLLGVCTRCTAGYWSHRRDGEAAGRQAAIIVVP